MKRDEDQQFDERTVQRVEAILAAMGWDKTYLAKEVYADLGHKTTKGVTHWFNRSRAIPRRGLSFIATFLGVDVAYFMQTTDDLESCIYPRGRYAIATKSRRTAV